MAHTSAPYMRNKSSGNIFAPYSFYVDFSDGTGRDRVSGTPMETVLSAGRVKPDGTPLGVNAPCIQDGKLNTLGQIELLNGMTDDISSPHWLKANAASVINYNTFKAISAYDNVYREISTLEGTYYTISVVLSVQPGGRTTNINLRHFTSASGNYTPLILTQTPTRYTITVLGKVGGGNVGFGVSDLGVAPFPTIHIDTINITKSAYLLPPVHNATTGPITIPHGYSDADEGYKWPLASCPKAVASLQGTAGNNAQGTIEVEWVPQYPNNVSANKFIITPNDTYFLYNSFGTGVGFNDMSKECLVAIPFSAGIKYKILGKYGPHPAYANAGKFQTIVTDGTTTWTSPITAFDGSFNPTTHLSVGYNNPYWQQLKSIKIKDGNPWI